MKKLDDFNKDDQRKLQSEVETGARTIGVDWYEDVSQLFSRKVFGRCSDCKYLHATRTKYDRVFAKCYINEIRLSSIDPVVECTSYRGRGEMDIEDMTRIATIIELPGRRIGFESE